MCVCAIMSGGVRPCLGACVSMSVGGYGVQVMAMLLVTPDTYWLGSVILVVSSMFFALRCDCVCASVCA